MKKKYLLLILTITAVAVAAIGGTLAAKSDKDTSMTAEISEKTLGVTVNKAESDKIIAMPGAENFVNYFVKNDGGLSNGTRTEKGSYDIYARVNLTFDWAQDEASKKEYGAIDLKADYDTLYLNVGTADKPEYVAVPKNDPDNNQIYISSYAEQVKVGDWIVTYYDNEQLTMYYTKPIEQDAVSSAFLSKIAFDTSMDNKYIDATLVVTADVNAIQAENADAAFATEWGVYPKFVAGDNGVNVIESISENAE